MRKKIKSDHVRLHIRNKMVAENMVKHNMIDHSLRNHWTTSHGPETECMNADKYHQLSQWNHPLTARVTGTGQAARTRSISPDEIFDHIITALVLRCSYCPSSLRPITDDHQFVQVSSYLYTLFLPTQYTVPFPSGIKAASRWRSTFNPDVSGSLSLFWSP